MVMETPTHFTLASRSLKLDTASDINAHLSPFQPVNSSEAGAKPTTITLTGNTLGVPACEHLALTLKTQPQLEIANLADIFTGRLLSEIPPALSALLTALLELPNLHTVDLSDNAFGLNTVEPLVEFLSQCVPLKHLILQNNGLGPAAGTKVADALTELAKRKEEARGKMGDRSVEGKNTVPELETLVCGRNRLESGSMAAWARMFTAHAAGIKTVKMVQNGIRQDGIAVLLKEGLGRCGGLEVLDLQDNTFTLTGARALAGVLGRWPNLRDLGIGDCLLGRRGGFLVAQALGGQGVGARLEVLRAQYNDIDTRGVKALCEVAENGAVGRLRRVELNGNKFAEDDVGLEGLRVVLEKRREGAGAKGDGVEGGGEWGLDELDELESEDEDEEDEEGEEDEEEREEEEEQEGRRENVLRDADEVEGQQVSEKKDVDVDELADQLQGTHV